MLILNTNFYSKYTWVRGELRNLLLSPLSTVQTVLSNELI